MLKIIAIIGISILSVCNPLHSQPADKIQDFTLLNAIDGQPFSLSQYQDAKAVVVIFTSLYCPYAKLYEDRIATLVDQYHSEDFRFVLINPNNPEKSMADAMPNMIDEVKRLQLDIPFLSDSAQEVASLMGAQKTPEAFILLPRNGSFRIAFHGGIDDNPQVEKDVNHQYLRDAIDAVTSNRPVASASTYVTGCMIKR